MEHVQAFIYAYGYAGLFALLMLGIAGLPFPDEWLLIFAGYLVYKGDFHAVPALATAIAGSICGISVSYGVGRTFGSFMVRRWGRWLHVTDEGMGRIRSWFGRAGRWGFVAGYFIPGARHLAGLVAGASKLRFADFAPFAYGGAFAWSACFVAVGYFSGKEWSRATRLAHRDIVIFAALAAVVVLAGLFLSKRARDRRAGRPTR